MNIDTRGEDLNLKTLGKENLPTYYSTGSASRIVHLKHQGPGSQEGLPADLAVLQGALLGCSLALAVSNFGNL